MGNSHRGPQSQWSLVAEMNPYAVRSQPGSAQPLPACRQSRSIEGSAQPPAAPAAAPCSMGSALGSLNPFRSRASAAAAAPVAHDRVGASDELNPLLFTGPQQGQQPAAAAAPSAGNGLAALRSLPAFTAFAMTLAPQLLHSIEADPVGFVRAVQSPELWALLDALPPDFPQPAEASTTSSASAASMTMSSSSSSGGDNTNTNSYNAHGDSSSATPAAFDALDPFFDKGGMAMTPAGGGDGGGEEHEETNLKIRPAKRAAPSRGPGFARVDAPPPAPLPSLLDDLEL